MESNWRRHRSGGEDDDGWRKWGKYLHKIFYFLLWKLIVLVNLILKFRKKQLA